MNWKGVMSHKIEIDCPPGQLRPWHLIDDIIEGTGLTTDQNTDDSHPHAFFGSCAWFFLVDDHKWDTEIAPMVGEKIKALYNSGFIRYGEWGKHIKE